MTTTYRAAVFTALCVLLGGAPTALGVPPSMTPDGDLDRDGEVRTSDLQCMVLVLERYLMGVSCIDEGDCAPGDQCRDAWGGGRACLPPCLSEDVVVITKPGWCDTPGVACVGQTPRHLADLNCDGQVTNVDIQFHAAMLLGADSGPGTPDYDGDGVLNFCDNDSDGDASEDADDCQVLDAASYPGAPEACDGRDNDCDGATDETDSLAPSLCANQAGACAGAQRSPALCTDGAWEACGEAELQGQPAWEAVELSCDGIDNDCDGLIDGEDPDAAGSDCCVTDADCGPEHASPPVCDDPANCHGSRGEPACIDFTCGTRAVPNDSGCTQQMLSFDCAPLGVQGVYCNGLKAQVAPVCPTACDGTVDCPPGAFCNAQGNCQASIPDGRSCLEDAACQSGHCENGFCCSAGACCADADDCGAFAVVPSCGDPAGCQGTRVDPVCQDHVCGASVVDDDSACTESSFSLACGLAADVSCTGEPEQSAPVCPATCAADDGCDPGAWCDGGACAPQVGDGAACIADAQCTSGHCQNGFCCAGGDCCADAGDCPATWSSPAACSEPTLCQGTRVEAVCQASVCGSVTIDDDTACTAVQPAVACSGGGTDTCDGTAEQSPPCPGSCLVDETCASGQHCEPPACVADLANGAPCDEASDCASGHCQNGYCCASGDCCQTADHCEHVAQGSTCTVPGACLGTAQQPACSNNQCTTVSISDSTGCTPDVVADGCGPYADVRCTGEASQSPDPCEFFCTSDAGCDATHYCQGSGCQVKRPDGASCTKAAMCQSGYCDSGICCAGGECCTQAGDCPTASEPPVCQSPDTCQGQRVDVACVSNVCEQAVVDDDSACGAGQGADACGAYPDVACTGQPDQSAPACAAACATGDDCDPNAFCADGVCTVDLPDGAACDADGDCVSGYCAGGICCQGGDCCLTATDCPSSWATPATCNTPGTCQGTRGVPACVSFQCATAGQPDDSACVAGTPANACGVYPDVTCAGGAQQSAPVCATTCASDADCDGAGHCQGGACIADLAVGAGCDRDDQCAGGVCDAGICCTEGDDCCATAADCSASTVPVCQDPGTCQGIRVNPVCHQSRCVNTQINDDSGCAAGTVANECGCYKAAVCDGNTVQSAPACPTSCTDDAQCDDSCHCDGTCVADVGDGGACDENSDCASGHCNSGICCSGGDCCETPGDCPLGYYGPSQCTDPAGCQGQRKEAACQAFTCVEKFIDDDKACSASTVADDCGLYAPVMCTGAQNQPAPAACATTCASNADCTDSLFCTGPEQCVDGQCVAGTPPVIDDGVACTIDQCDEANDVVTHTPDHGACDDGQFCTGQEACDAAADCVLISPPPALDDGVPCTLDTCDEAADQVRHTPQHAQCDNGVFCDGAEQCDPVVGCKPGAPPVVDDGVACTLDSCDEAAGVVRNDPDDSVCTDTLVCTSSVCNKSLGCLAAITTGFCVIDGQCLLSGAVNPESDCERCNPVESQISWTARAPEPEVCNGIDDDCDLGIDTDEAGDPLLVTCQNSCGTVGTAQCALGAAKGCSVQDPPEVCDDALDNDCDGVTDETDCAIDKPTLTGVDLRAETTLGVATGLFEDLGGGRYATQVEALREPNTAGQITVRAHLVPSEPGLFEVLALPAAFIEAVVARDTLHVDRPATRFVVQVKDELDRPPAVGTVVQVTLSGLPNAGSETLSCLTAADGRCRIDWTAPAALFQGGGQVLAAIRTGSLPPIFRTLTAVAAPPPLAVPNPGCGVQLPRHPLQAGETFDAQVVLNTGGETLASYEMELTFPQADLQVVSVSGGACIGAGFPTSNVGGDANDTGLLKFNATGGGSDPCRVGSVHVATVRFAATLAAGAEATIAARAVNAFDTSLAPILINKVCVVADQGATTESGTLTGDADDVVGILARTPISHLADRAGLTGAPDTTQIQVTGITRDLAETELSGHPDTTYDNPASEVVSVSATGLVAAGSTSGTAILTITHGARSSSARLRVRTPRLDAVAIQVSDATLSTIAGAGRQQTATVRAILDWEEDGEVAFREDITDQLTWTPSPGLSWSAFSRTAVPQTAGSKTLTATTAAGLTVGVAELESAPAQQVSCTGLQLEPACELEMERVDPSKTNVALGQTRAEVVVNAFMDTYLQSCQVEVYATTDDGGRVRLTGDPNVTVTSADTLVFTTTADGLMTAQGDGEAQANATWTVGGTPVCAGSGDVLVKLPKAVAITVTPISTQLAIGPADPAATVKGLPIAQQLQVRVHFADGSSIDFTEHHSTVYDADTLDPQSLVQASDDGLVTPTGGGSGEAKVRVSVGQYPQLPPAEPLFVVIEATGVTADLYEPYTPTPPRVLDHVLEVIEGTATHQDALWEVLLDFSDGSQLNVTSEAQAEALVPGTNTADTTVVGFTGSPARVIAKAAGTVDVRLSAHGFERRVENVQVVSDSVGVAALVPALPQGGTTLSAIKDGDPVALTTWGILGDGTRRRLSGARAVPGLLSYTSTVPEAATIDAAGLATAHSNRATVLAVDVAAGVDVGAAFDPPAELPVAVNLLPAVGDVDLGDTVGLAHKDREPGQTFTMEARVNTGDLALGAFDVEVTYDPTVVIATAVAPGADVSDAVFNFNVEGQPGKVLFNGTLPAQAAARKGPGIRLATITFEALKPESTPVTLIAGTVREMAALDTVQPVGPATPRPLVAGEGELDPLCRGEAPGDLNGDCVATVADLRRLQQGLAGLRPVEAHWDLTGDGRIDAADAAWLAARITD